MRVRIDKHFATPLGSYSPGEIVKFSDKEALELIEAGYATNAVIWLASVASDLDFDIKPKKQPKKLAELMDF